MILLAAPNIVRFPAIVLAAASIIHWLILALVKPLSIITKLYNATNGTLLKTWLIVILIKEITALL